MSTDPTAPKHPHDHHGHHHHGHDHHAHDHSPTGDKGLGDTAMAAHLHAVLPDDPALRVKALESLLVEKGLVDRAAMDAWIEAFETKIGPHNGAQVVARAWSDPAYKQRLLADGTSAIAEMGFLGQQGQHMVVVENTPAGTDAAAVHNLVVCTLCSCYPWPVLGLPPRWYKAAPYRARVVQDPRGVLQEFGVTVDAGTEVRVWDSTAEIRYLVLPERPQGSEGLSEAELAALVTRDSMIGVGRALAPADAGGNPAGTGGQAGTGGGAGDAR